MDDAAYPTRLFWIGHEGSGENIDQKSERTGLMHRPPLLAVNDDLARHVPPVATAWTVG